MTRMRASFHNASPVLIPEKPMLLKSLDLYTFFRGVLLGLILILVPLTLLGVYVASQGDSQIPEPIDSVAFGS
jgi:hypothetical protein